MKAYTVFHFATEEKFMAQYNYPDYENHKKEHVEFIEKVKRGTIIVSFEITSFLKD